MSAQYILLIINLFHNKSMQYHEFIVFCFTIWIKSESNHPFSTPTDYWTCTWFVAHICWHDSGIIILWKKETIFKFLQQKIDRNTNGFNSRSNYFSLKNKIKPVLSSQYTVGAPVCSAKASMYLQITFFSLQICTCI